MIYVGFWKRVLAFAVDSALVAIITLPLLTKIYGLRHTGIEDYSLVQGPVDFVVSYLIPAVLVIGFWHFKLATPGKMAVSAIIVDEKTLAKPSTSQLIIRYFGYYLSLLGLGAGFVWIGIDGKKQGWHDKLAGTVVIHRKKPEKDNI